MTLNPMAARLAVYLLLAAEDDGHEYAPEIFVMAETIVGSLTAAEFERYADEYDDSRARWEVSRAIAAAHAN